MINEQITTPVAKLLIGENLGGKNISKMENVPIDKALSLAKDAGLDLVEVAAGNTYKIYNYREAVFQARRAQRAAKSKQHTVKLKEIRLGPLTDGNDFALKMKKAKEFLDRGDKVKLTMRFRGRLFATAKGMGHQTMMSAIAELDKYGKLDFEGELQERHMTQQTVLTISPLGAKAIAARKAAEAEAAAAGVETKGQEAPSVESQEVNEVEKSDGSESEKE